MRAPILLLLCLLCWLSAAVPPVVRPPRPVKPPKINLGHRIHKNNVVHPLYGQKVHPWGRGPANAGQRFLKYAKGKISFFQLAVGEAPTNIMFQETPTPIAALPPANHNTQLQGVPAYANSPRISHLRKIDYPAGTVHFSQRPGQLPTDMLFTAKAIPLASLPDTEVQFGTPAVAAAAAAEGFVPV